MSTSEYRDYVMEKLESVGGISCKPMMGDYVLYYKNQQVGGIYEDNLLIKIVATNRKYGLFEQKPYANAKPMFLIEDLEDKDYLKEIITATIRGL